MKKLFILGISIIVLTVFGCSDKSAGGSNTTKEICNNNVDDDGDGFVDCDDQDCLLDEACTVQMEICDNNVDDDLDGFTDCDDLDCIDSCEYLETCNNNIDDDGDGFVDCDDQDCIYNQACSKPKDEICNNGIDDDWDGFVDCDDSDCDGKPVCTALIPEICDNGIDDDNDGFIDCDDAECINECSYLEICNNNIDDDGDGFVDCDDQDCINSQLCIPVEICSNTTDDDGDGRVSCLDTDCFGEDGCGECNPFRTNGSGCSADEFCFIDVQDGYIPRCFSSKGNADEGENCNDANDCRAELVCFEGQCLEPCYPDVRDSCDCIPFTDISGVTDTVFGYCNN